MIDNCQHPVQAYLCRINHRMAQVARDLKDHQCNGQGHLSLDQVSQSSIQPGLKEFQGWDIQTSLGNSIQCLTTPTVKNFFLIFSLNLLSISLKPFPLVVSLRGLVQSPSPSSLQTLFRFRKKGVGFPLPQSKWRFQIPSGHCRTSHSMLCTVAPF